MDVARREWKDAAISYSTLSELELTLGEVGEGVEDAEQSVTFADHSGDSFQRQSKRTTLADALHQAGRRTDAETRFREADEIQIERQPDYRSCIRCQASGIATSSSRPPSALRGRSCRGQKSEIRGQN